MAHTGLSRLLERSGELWLLPPVSDGTTDTQTTIKALTNTFHVGKTDTGV